MTCLPSDKSRCFNGVIQVRKVAVNNKIARALDKYDIAVQNWPTTPRVYLISRRLKELLVPQQFSGCKLVPCLNVGEEYSEEESAFSSNSERPWNIGKYFQIIMTNSTKGPPTVGKLLAVNRCSRCQTARMFIGEREERFRPDDLYPTDFQYYSRVSTTDHGTLDVSLEIPVVSARVLQCFIDNGIKGLKPYSKDPPIKYAAVLFENESVCKKQGHEGVLEKWHNEGSIHFNDENG